jgi:hypothetical protein
MKEGRTPLGIKRTWYVKDPIAQFAGLGAKVGSESDVVLSTLVSIV